MPSRSSLRKQLLLFCSVSLLSCVTANVPTLCYVIDGAHNANAGYRCDNGTTGHSTCCAAGATCYTNGLCVQMNGQVQDFLRVGCTDPTWQDPACLDQCTSYARSSTAGIRYCNGSLTTTTRYCCDDGSHGVGSFACCADESDIFQLKAANFLAQVPLDYTSTTSSTTSSTASTSSSTILSTITSGSSTVTSAISTTIATDPAAVSSVAPLPLPSTSTTNSSHAVAIGVGVGVGCGVVALALLGFLFYRHKSKQRQQPTEFKNSEAAYSPQAGGYHDSPIAGANPALSPMEQKGGYYAPGQTTVGPSPTEKYAGVQRPQELQGESNVFEMPGDHQRMV